MKIYNLILLLILLIIVISVICKLSNSTEQNQTIICTDSIKVEQLYNSRNYFIEKVIINDTLVNYVIFNGKEIIKLN